MAISSQVMFKPTDQLFNKIKEDFASFDAGNMLDEGKFYADVKYIIGRLGIAWYKPAEEILEIENYSACLPEGFHLLDFAYRVDSTIQHNNSSGQQHGIVFRKLTYDKFTENNDYHASSQSCDKNTDCIFNSHEEILVERPHGMFRYNNPTLLRLGNVSTRKQCNENCINISSTSQDTISIQNRRIYTNFSEGNIYIQYTSFPTDEETGLPLIPDNIHVEKAIEYYIKSNLIENYWVNGDADVAQKVQYFNQKFTESMGNAINETKTPSFSTMVEMVRRTKKKLNLYQM